MPEQWRMMLFFALTVGVNLIMGWLAWRANRYADVVWAAAHKAAGQAQTTIDTLKARCDHQAQELRTLSHRNRLLTNELRCDDTSQTRAWSGAKPEPYQA